MNKFNLFKKRYWNIIPIRMTVMFAIALFYCAASIYASDTGAITVSGIVTDITGDALPGVNVVVKGTSIGTATDENGKYALQNVSTDAVLVFSFLGMNQQEVRVDGKSVINVTLEEQAFAMNEVIVVGYPCLLL